MSPFHPLLYKTPKGKGMKVAGGLFLCRAPHLYIFFRLVVVVVVCRPTADPSPLDPRLGQSFVCRRLIFLIGGYAHHALLFLLCFGCNDTMRWICMRIINTGDLRPARIYNLRSFFFFFFIFPDDYRARRLAPRLQLTIFFWQILYYGRRGS